MRQDYIAEVEELFIEYWEGCPIEAEAMDFEDKADFVKWETYLRYKI